VKTNGGLKSVCSTCGDETSTLKEEVRENRHKKAPRLYIFRKKARNGPFGDDSCPNRSSPSIQVDAKTLLLMEFASIS
jgi:hypothetical protein